MVLDKTSDILVEGEINDDVIDNCILGIASRDKHSLEQLYLLTSTEVYAYALTILKNRYDAEDVLQNVYVKVYSSATNYKSNGKAKAYIMTIARNLCMEKLRERSKEVGDLQEDWNTIVDDRSDMPIEDKLLLEKCMKILDEEERQIVILHAVAGFKHREIAKELNMLLSTVLSKYNRAIKKLQNEFLKETNYE